MKKILTHLTGIVFLITILVAGSCKRSTQPNDTATEENGSREVQKQAIVAEDDPTKVEIYLREIKIGGSMHLLMSDSRRPKYEVIDGLITDVNRGDSVIFMKGKNSRIRGVEDIRLLEEDFNINEIKIEVEGKVYYKLKIDSNASPNDTLVKYVIDFTVKDHKDTIYTIDPYLRIPY